MFLVKPVQANLRKRHDEGDPIIVAEMGGLFLKYSPDKVKAIIKAQKGRCQGATAPSLKSSSA